MEIKKILEPTPSKCVDRWVEMYFEEKHRAEVAEEALSIAGEHICDNCDIDCNSKNCFAGRMYLIDYFKQQAEERLKERNNEII